MRRLLWHRQIAGDGAGYNDLVAWRSHGKFLQSERPPSTTKVVPVAKPSCVAQATIAEAISSGVAIRFSGVVAAILVLKSAPRPGTKLVSTTPGATASTRTSGASPRASDLVMTSMPALAAQ